MKKEKQYIDEVPILDVYSVDTINFCDFVKELTGSRFEEIFKHHLNYEGRDEQKVNME